MAIKNDLAFDSFLALKNLKASDDMPDVASFANESLDLKRAVMIDAHITIGKIPKPAKPTVRVPWQRIAMAALNKLSSAAALAAVEEGFSGCDIDTTSRTDSIVQPRMEVEVAKLEPIQRAPIVKVSGIVREV